ncbi:MAG: hypothetical protein WBF42_06120 [Terracidiphilus sp.]
MSSVRQSVVTPAATPLKLMPFPGRASTVNFKHFPNHVGIVKAKKSGQ